MALRGGTRFKVTMADVFPNGCHLVPASIVEAQDFDERSGRRSPAKDKVTGQRVFSCRVMDMDPELDGRSREIAVKILADVQPVAPTGAPFEPVEFEGMTVTPYVTDKGRMAFSLRATAITAPKGGKAAPAPAPGKAAA
ncbi:plasmid replication, integration and excision activator [Actinoallomurus spadix]|uniref:Regulatory protein n=1 Tax=Actinoallomurus spadix TaxID=79912 RepID=A0ABN0XAP6_9ACTN|nr:plasmid replication, integration and excision activator [Actinoallomurus spadix]MCO5987908.1 plasmid replication, integration and excision activator [Actinoallomurus spadix]